MLEKKCFAMEVTEINYMAALRTGGAASLHLHETQTACEVLTSASKVCPWSKMIIKEKMHII